MTPKNEKHREYWTSCYPIVSLLPVAALVVEANRGDYAAATQPLLALWSEADHVVDPEATKRILSEWGGEVTRAPVAVGPDDDASTHVIAGDVLSPGQTAPVATRINGWIAENFGE